MDFVDLKTQQRRIKEQLDANVQKVFAHGNYIMGPEIKELEKKLAAYHTEIVDELARKICKDLNIPFVR